MKIELISDSTDELIAEFEVADEIVEMIRQSRNIAEDDEEGLKTAVQEIILESLLTLEEEINNEVE